MKKWKNWLSFFVASKILAGDILTVSKTKVLVVNCHLQSIESSICVGDNMIYNQVGLSISNYLHQ